MRRASGFIGLLLVLTALFAWQRRDAKRGNGRIGAIGSVRTTGRAGDADRGLALMTAFRDSLPEHSGNALRCVSCHLDNGTRPTALSWAGVARRYPQHRSRRGGEESLARRVNECIARSLAGRTLPEDSQEMRDMLAYLHTVRERARPETAVAVLLAGNPAHGESGYASQCARCHGSVGEGTAIAPAVWGIDSYAIGAGMARQFTLATFLRHNMPYDRAASLSEQDAADIAAFVLTQPRQDHPGKERDWPKGDPPRDVAYRTAAAARAGVPQPAVRPVLPRRVQPIPSSPLR